MDRKLELVQAEFIR